MPTPEEALSPLRSEIAARLEDMRKRGAGTMLSVAFPRLPARAFADVALSPEAGLLFFFENAKFGVAEAAFSLGADTTEFFRNVRLRDLEKLLPERREEISAETPDGARDGKSAAVPAPKIFAAGTFSDPAGTLAAIPRWQMSREADSTRIAAHVFPSDESPETAADKIVAEFLRVRRLAGTPPRLSPLPEIPREEEVGGNWYAADGGAAKALRAIESEAFRKIVLARAKDFFYADARAFPAETLLAALRERFLGSGCTVYFARTDADGEARKFLGATPETLVRARRGRLETEAVAGTAPTAAAERADASRGNVPPEAKLLSDEKELREHRFVVEDIAAKLRALGAEPRFPDAPQVLRLPNVRHLRTPISARVPATLTPGALAEALHPTPAMCGVPAKDAEKFIRETEPFPRGNFAAPIGFADSDGNGFFAVAIRCAEISPEKIRLFAASGLVGGSVPAKESAEIDAKFSAVASILRAPGATRR